MSDEGGGDGGSGSGPDRRDLLQALGGLGAAGLAGCPGGSGENTETATETDADAPTDTPTAIETPTNEPTQTPVDSPTRTPTDTPDAPDPTPTESETPTDTESDPGPDPGDDSELAMLVLSATDGYRHEAIETGNAVVADLADEIVAEHDVDSAAVDVVDAPDGDAAAFPSSADELAGYDAVVWNNTTGSILDADQRAAFRSYVENGGGFAGVHAAADTHYDWGWYGDLVGAYFDDHPSPQRGTVTVTDQAHPSTAHLPATWDVEDEWYDYRSNPRGDVHVLATLDEDTYDGATMENSRTDHPIAWCHEVEDGRSWYTGRGHTAACFEEDAFREHLKNGVAWAAGVVDGDATGTVWDSYERTTLHTDLDEPMDVQVAPDGRVFVSERGGTILVVDGDDESDDVSTALDVDVYDEQEDGLAGFVLGPNFAETGWVYVYYSPPNDVVGDDPYNRLSRFTADGDAIDPDSEVEILRVYTQRAKCCHTGGDLTFGPDGLLYVTAGDDTSAFESEGYAPLDEREGREWNDSQRTAADTADLRGSILRVRPHEDGSYSVPEDNLFTEAQGYSEELEAGLVREEIYAMGVRNPFTTAVDDRTGWLYFADYGPDAGEWSAERGPPGIVEFNQAREAGNFGWPYDVGPNVPYRDYDFATGTASEPFDPSAPVNGSPNNDGLEELPPSEEATLYYPRTWEGFFATAPDWVDLPHDRPPHPELAGGGAPMAGPVYYAEDGFGDGALPASFDGKHFVMEWNRNWLQYVSFDDGEVAEIDPFLPDETFRKPMDLAVGPDGALFLLEFGDWEGDQGTRLSRIEHDPA